MTTTNNHIENLTADNFASIMHTYFKVDEDKNVDVKVLLHAEDPNIDEHVREASMTFNAEMSLSRLRRAVELVGDNFVLFPYQNIHETKRLKIDYSKINENTMNDIRVYMTNVLFNPRIKFEPIESQLNALLNNLPEYYFSYIKNKDYMKLIIDYIKKCRFTNIEKYFNAATSIFKKQEAIYDIFSKYNNILIGGGTGIGKTAVIPLMYYHYLKSIDATREHSLLICEPRISTTKGPFMYMRTNTGTRFTYTFNELDEIIKNRFKDIIPNNKKEVDNKKEDNSNDDKEDNTEKKPKKYDKLKLKRDTYTNNLFYRYAQIQMRYKGHNYVDRNVAPNITFMTDGILYMRLINRHEDVYKHSLLVVDEVHENTLNSLISLALIAAYRLEDERTGEGKWTQLKVMLITAMCQKTEKTIFTRLLPGLYDLNWLPNATNFKVIESDKSSNNKNNSVSNHVDPKRNGLAFISNDFEIENELKIIKTKYTSLECIKLTRQTNTSEYNGDVSVHIGKILKSGRKYIILATNIAESSITFPELEYVIDTGKQINVTYDVNTKMTKYQNEYMTANSKVQRMGRVGRTQDGTYIRLYKQSQIVEYRNRIKTENLTSKLLDVICKVKDDNVRINFFNILKDIFDSRDVVEKYLSDFKSLGLIDDMNVYSPSESLKSIYKMSQNIQKSIRKFDPTQLSILDSTVNSAPDLADTIVDDDGDADIDDDQNKYNSEPAENTNFIVCTMLYYCNRPTMQKFAYLYFTNKLIDLLSSSEYRRYIDTQIKRSINESDLIVLFKYLVSYPVNENYMNELKNIIKRYNIYIVDTPMISKDVDKLVFTAIQKSLHFSRIKLPIPSSSKFSSVRVSSGRERNDLNSTTSGQAYVLQLSKMCTLYHTNNYFVNDVFILADPTDMISSFYRNYLYQNIITPSPQSYRIEDDRVVLVYPDIGYEFATNQHESLIDYFNSRYTDLYSCCFNTQSLKVYLPRSKFKLPNGQINDESRPYEVYKIANPNINCTNITENECVFFQRWYCRALRDLVGVDDMQKYDANCNCYIFDPRNQMYIKMGDHVNCYDSRCTTTSIRDPILTSDVCQSTTCSNMFILQDILAKENVDISNVSLNLSCK